MTRLLSTLMPWELFDIHLHGIEDQLTWEYLYEDGIREPRYPVPAHAYITLITPHTVEMVTGVTKEYGMIPYGEVHIDCECVFFTCNYPKETVCD